MKIFRMYLTVSIRATGAEDSIKRASVWAFISVKPLWITWRRIFPLPASTDSIASLRLNSQNIKKKRTVCDDFLGVLTK